LEIVAVEYKDDNPPKSETSSTPKQAKLLPEKQEENKTMEQRTYTMPYYDDTPLSEKSSMAGDKQTNDKASIPNNEPDYIECFLEGKNYVDELDKSIEAVNE
jgi:hypothetical protein